MSNQLYIFKLAPGVWSWQMGDREEAESERDQWREDMEAEGHKMLSNTGDWEGWDWASTFEEMCASERVKEALKHAGLESPRMI